MLFRSPLLHGVGPVPYPALQRLFDGLYTKGLQCYWRADFVNELSDELIEQHLEWAQKLPSMHSTMHLYPINGAVLFKHGSNGAFGSVKAEVSYKNVLHLIFFLEFAEHRTRAG